MAEAIRSGINAVPLGQAEAARAIGLTFGGTMTQVVLPQAFRATVPPLASVFIALLKNTSVAYAFGILEATARMKYFTNISGNDLPIFLLFAAGLRRPRRGPLLRREPPGAPLEGGAMKSPHETAPSPASLLRLRFRGDPE